MKTLKDLLVWRERDIGGRADMMFYEKDAVDAIWTKWISVDERLPDEDVSVFVITELGYKFSDSVHSKTFDYENTIESIAAATGSIKEDHITHWLDNVPPAPEAAQ